FCGGRPLPSVLCNGPGQCRRTVHLCRRDDGAGSDRGGRRIHSQGRHAQRDGDAERQRADRDGPAAAHRSDHAGRYPVRARAHLLAMRMTPARDFAAKGTAHASQRPLRIVHCFRSPLGGIFRHVADLVEEQARAGHAVGVICDSTTGTALEEDVLKRLAPKLALGIRRTPMRRQVSPSDLAATWRLLREVRSLNPDILHAHGAKGGAYARTIGTLLRAFGLRVARIYSPHGGSIHYDPKSLSGRVYFALERVLGWMTDAFIFVSHYEADTYAAKIGKPRSPSAIVLNGL